MPSSRYPAQPGFNILRERRRGGDFVFRVKSGQVGSDVRIEVRIDDRDRLTRSVAGNLTTGRGCEADPVDTVSRSDLAGRIARGSRIFSSLPAESRLGNDLAECRADRSANLARREKLAKLQRLTLKIKAASSPR